MVTVGDGKGQGPAFLVYGDRDFAQLNPVSNGQPNRSFNWIAVVPCGKTAGLRLEIKTVVMVSKPQADVRFSSRPGQ